MIIQGKKGSLVLFYNNKLISGFPLGYHNYERYKTQSENLILDSLRKNKSMKDQINMYKYFCDLIYERKINNQKISGLDHQKFCACLLSLVRLKVIDEDDAVFIAPRKKGKRGKKFIQYL